MRSGASLACSWLATSALLAAPMAVGAGLAFLENTALVDLTDEDRELQRAAALDALESSGSKKEIDWSNASSGSTGRIRVQGRFKAEDGSLCRKMHLTAQARGATSTAAFPVCKDAEGLWYIASGKKIPGLQ